MADDHDHDIGDGHRAPPDQRAHGTEPDTTPIVEQAEAVDHLRREDPSRQHAASPDRWRGREVAWVRMSDVLAQRSDQMAGRGITWTTAANRVPRLAPLRSAGTGRRAIDRASSRRGRLAPLSAFGARRSQRSAMGIAR